MKLTLCMALVISALLKCESFVLPSSLSRHVERKTIVGFRKASTARAFREEKPPHFLLDEFTTYSGEIIDPYKTLKLSRDADRSEVRRAYITLSKRYHVDAIRHDERGILPGKWCVTLYWRLLKFGSLNDGYHSVRLGPTVCVF